MPGCNPGFHTAFNFYVSLISGLWYFLSFSLVFRTLTGLRNSGQVFCRCSPFWMWLILFSWLDWGYGFGEENHKEGPSSWTWHVIIRGYTISTWLFSDELNFDHLGKVMFASFLHCEVTSFPFLYSLLWLQITESSPCSRGWGLSSTFWREDT